ncbi:MAG: nonstructural protein [Microvirus sp.]|nr:MAG: nonstructural protein [Microvirus sp.]
MKLKAFSILDTKTNAFAAPWFMPSTGLAVRVFTDVVNEPGNTINKHPEDFRLFQIGEWEDGTGVFENIQPPLAIASAAELKTPSSQLELLQRPS